MACESPLGLFCPGMDLAMPRMPSSVWMRLCPTLQGGLDHRVLRAIITSSECFALLAAFIIVLSMLGIS